MKMTLPLVRDYMATRVTTLTPEVNILDAVDLLVEQQISGAPVVSEGRLVGMLSEKDCLRLLSKGRESDADVPTGTVGDYMVTDVRTIPPDMDIYYVAGLFLNNPYRRYPVVDDGVIVGQISRRDVLRAIQAFVPRE